MKNREITIETLTAEDWPEARAIFEEGIASGISSLEQNAPNWEDFDRNHLTICRLAGYIDQNLAGWAALTPVSHRSAYAGVAEVSVYVSARYHNKGVGSFLMDKLIACSEDNGIWTLQSTIFPENKPSIGLHKKFGFRLVGYREKIAKNREGMWQDTILMERRSAQIK